MGTFSFRESPTFRGLITFSFTFFMILRIELQTSPPLIAIDRHFQSRDRTRKWHSWKKKNTARPLPGLARPISTRGTWKVKITFPPRFSPTPNWEQKFQCGIPKNRKFYDNENLACQNSTVEICRCVFAAPQEREKSFLLRRIYRLGREKK